MASALGVAELFKKIIYLTPDNKVAFFKWVNDKISVKTQNP
jgi:hypothetical protein